MYVYLHTYVQMQCNLCMFVVLYIWLFSSTMLCDCIVIITIFIFTYIRTYVAPLMISNQPKSVVVRENDGASLECSAYGIGPIFYEWEKYWSANDSWIMPLNDFINITSSKLIFDAITEEDEGIYHCVVFNDDGSVTSNNATITVYGK